VAAVTYRQSPGDEERRKFAPDVHAVTTMPHLHRVGHDGFLYHASGKVTGMVDTNVDDFLIVTPASPEVNFSSVGLKVGEGDVDIQVYEDTTVSAAGSALTELNTNRNSSNTPGTVLTFGPTVTGVGTLIHTDWIPPTATGIGATPGGASTIGGKGEEWILKPSSNYMIRITNNSGATIAYQWEMAWYEPDYPSGEN
jgi:hypothetical protein